VAFKVTTSSKGKSKKEEETSDDEDACSSSSVEDEVISLCVLVREVHEEERLWCKKEKIIIQGRRSEGAMIVGRLGILWLIVAEPSKITHFWRSLSSTRH